MSLYSDTWRWWAGLHKADLKAHEPYQGFPIALKNLHGLPCVQANGMTTYQYQAAQANGDVSTVGIE